MISRNTKEHTHTPTLFLSRVKIEGYTNSGVTLLLKKEVRQASTSLISTHFFLNIVAQSRNNTKTTDSRRGNYSMSSKL